LWGRGAKPIAREWEGGRMNYAETVQAIGLLEKNIDLYERIQDPTEYECAMYRNIWEIYCRFKDELVILEMCQAEKLEEIASRN